MVAQSERTTHDGRCRFAARGAVAVVIAFALVGGCIIGFGFGYFGFKVRTRWCKLCGTALNCPYCLGAGAHRLITPSR